ncbi:MAG TPA: VCBS repeat-containing protein, partial [Candidatus Absconditabacterales bacterium]|nr:VCBS repeat-containing protein [Candidatus Absconditabacterales bacterium]
ITDSDQMKIGSHQAALVVVKDIWMNQIIDPVDLQIGLIGSLSSSGSTLFSVPVQQGQTSFPFQGLAPGGKGYIYAYLKGVALENQKPGYKSLFVKNNFLPTDKLNVMYLNLFGADRGNMWGFFSDYSGVVTEMITRSEKLLAVTTMLVDPSHVRQTPFVIANNLTLDVSPDQRVFLEVSSSGFSYLIDGVGRAALGSYSDYVFRSKPLLENVTLNDFLSNSVVYVPELTDDEIETNLLQGYKVVINGETYVDFSQNFLKPGVEILYSHEKILGHSLFDVSFEGKKIGSLLLSRDDTFIGDQKDNLVQIFDHSVYSVIDVFAEGSTNGMRGVGISLIDVVLAADSDTVSSIQDSIDPEKNIAFQAQYKNITAFSAGQPVGESSLAFGSEFVVNFGDPALKRIDSNDPITSTDFDGGIGKTIYSDSTKTIHLVKEIDFNADGQKDLAIIYNDGTVKFLKEYGGNVSSTDLGPALLIADGIEDLNVGDVDGNGYPDLLVKTPAQKLRVYRNNEGIFDVDGTNVCLDVPGGPQDLSQVYQIFFQDMDLDDKLDIITNDSDGSIKIFYGGSSSAGPHYLSTDSFG